MRPEFVSCTDYKTLKEITKSFPQLQSVIDSENLETEKIKNSYSFILRSNNDDDIHKAIKYGIWSSTPQNNEMLSNIFKKAQEEQKDIYLFYSVVKSG